MANLDEVILEWKETQKYLMALNLAIENDELIEQKDVYHTIKQNLGKEIQLKFARVIQSELNSLMSGRAQRISDKKIIRVERMLKYVIKEEKFHEKLKQAILDSTSFYKDEKENCWVISDKYLFLINSIKTHLVYHFIKMDNDALMLKIIMRGRYNVTIDRVIDFLLQNEIHDNKMDWSKLLSSIHFQALEIRYPVDQLEDNFFSENFHLNS
jgi:hypothetical protein